MGDQVRIPRVVIPFSFLFSPSFSKAIGTVEPPSLCNVVSSFYQLFVPHCAMIVFICIYLHHRINKPRDTSFEFFSILSIVDLSKHLITALIIGKFIQLVNFVTFRIFFFFFGNQVYMLINVRARIYSACRTFHHVLSLKASP